MSIRDTQLERATEQVLTKCLREGRYPRLSEIQQAVDKRFQDRPAGLPQFAPYWTAPKEISDPNRYNRMIDTLYEDLLVLYTELVRQANRLMALSSHYETEKQRLSLHIKRLRQRIENAKARLNAPPHASIQLEFFHDFLNIDFEGDASRGISATTAFVDLQKEAVYLPEIAMKSQKHDLASAQISVSTSDEVKALIPLGSPENLLNDYHNASWRHHVITEEAKPLQLSMRIQLAQAVEANYLALQLLVPKPVSVTLRLSENSTGFEEQETKKGTELLEWHLGRKTIKEIELIFQKDEPDASDAAEYHYYFGAKSLTLAHKTYLPEAVLVSQPYALSAATNAILIEPDEIVPPETKIEYFLAEDTGEGILEWKPVRPNEPLYVRGLEEAERILDSQTPGYGAFYTSLYNQDYFVLDKLEHEPLPGLVTLQLGDGMYQLETLTKELDSAHIPTLEDWMAAPAQVTFIDLDELANGKSLTVEAKQLGRLTLYVKMKEEVVIPANPLHAQGVNVSVYLNNMPLRAVGGGYSYYLQKGWNKLEVLFYAPKDGQLAVNFSRAFLESLGAESCFGRNEPLTQVDLHTLLHNTSKRDYTKFALDAERNLVVNYDPKRLDHSGNGVRYRLAYAYPKDPEQRERKVRLLARLKTGSNAHTPILKGYKLVAK